MNIRAFQSGWQFGRNSEPGRVLRPGTGYPDSRFYEQAADGKRVMLPQGDREGGQLPYRSAGGAR